MSLAQILEVRGIEEVLHFTTNKGLVGMLAAGAVLPRKRLPEEKYLEFVYSPNANSRKDVAWLDYVNLSISRINVEFFDISSSRWHAHEDLWWCILSFRSEILSHEDVYLCTTNNFYSGVVRESGAGGFEALFAERVVQFVDWSGREVRAIARPTELEPRFPTCIQAEALYPGELSLKFLQRIYVARPRHQDIAYAQCKLFESNHTPVEVKPEMFTEPSP